MSVTRLITIGLSHYCEKARWALDYCNIPFVEEMHAPGGHSFATRPHGGKSVPVLVHGKTVLTDSTPIVAWAVEKSGTAGSNESLIPLDPALRDEALELEDLFDRKLGVASRVVAYYHLIDVSDLMLPLMVENVGCMESFLVRLFFPILRRVMKSGMKIDAENAAKSLLICDDIFDMVGKRLVGGKRFLVGDTFTVADLTFASLAVPIICPDENVLMKRLVDNRNFPRATKELLDKYRATPAGQFALRLYREHRHKVIAN